MNREKTITPLTMQEVKKLSSEQLVQMSCELMKQKGMSQSLIKKMALPENQGFQEQLLMNPEITEYEVAMLLTDF